MVDGKWFSRKGKSTSPEMTTEFINSVTERYIELFEKVSGKEFLKNENQKPLDRIRENVVNVLRGK